MGITSIDSLIDTQKLLSISDEDLFDIKTSVENKKNYQDLIRLIKTYKEYINKSSSMKYFGFVGHFSSGKSSTINSILESGNKRKAGLHPVDTGITVITHPDNRGKLLISKSSEQLTSGVQLFESGILKDAAFVDTPGTGDQKVLSELVTDYLPICDEIIFIISATQPLTDSEIPIIVEVCKNLDFIPTCLVVTRCDEFKIDRSKRLSKKNFSTNHYEQFESILKSRLSLIVGDNRFQDYEIIPIDNMDRYGIDTLKMHIKQTTDDNDFNITSIKDDFFRKRGKDIISSFKLYIEKKYDELEYLKDKSDENHTEYSNEAGLENNKLTENWRDRKEELKNILGSVKTFHQSLKNEIVTSNNFLDGSHKERKKLDLNKYSMDQSIGQIKYIFEREQVLVINKIKKYITSYYEKEDSDFSYFELLDLAKPKFTNGFLEIYKRVFTEHVDYLLESLIWETSNISRISLGNTKLKRAIKSNRFLIKSEDVYNASISELDRMMNSYLQLVRLYKAGITSKDLRETIKKLGLSKLIDDADKVAFSEIQINSWKKELRDGIFPGNFDFSLHPNFLLQSTQLIEDIEEKTQHLSDQINILKSQLEVSQVPVAIIELIVNDFNQNFIDLSSKWLNTAIKEIDSVNQDKKEYHQQYKREVYANAFFKSVSASSITFGVLIASYVGWTYFSQPVDNSIGASLGIGITGSLIASSLVGVIRFLSDGDRENSSNIIPNNKKHKSVGEIMTFHTEALLSSLKDTNKKAAKESVNYFYTDSRKVVFQSTSGKQVNNICKETNILHSQFLELIELHSENVSFPINKVIDRLEKVEDNLGSLDSISKKIQEKAINPVLQKFHEYSEKLSTVMKEIRLIYEKY